MITIRAERPEDGRAVWTVHEAAFGRPDEARLVAQLRQEARPCVSLVAERGGRAIGHVFFSPVTIAADGAASPAEIHAARIRHRAASSPVAASQAEIHAARIRHRAASSPVAASPAEIHAARIRHGAASSPVAASQAGALAPVGVLPDEQGRGAGAALIRAGIEAARGLAWPLLFVLGNPAYYGRFGFALAAPHGLHYESHAFDVAFQVQELAPGVLALTHGWVRYHPAFGRRNL